MKKLTAAVMSFLLVFMLVTGSEMVDVRAAGEITNAGYPDAVEFPLEDQMTFEIMMSLPKDINDYLEKIEFLNWWQEETNIKFNFTDLGLAAQATEKLMLLFNSGMYGDAIFGGMILNESQTSQYGSAGLLIPLNEYMDDPAIMPRINERVFAESPQTKGYLTCPDGNIYNLPIYNNLPGNYLESPIWINKQWLDNLDLEIPTTMDEFTNVLRAFRDGDPNGNGLKDEIPYIAREGESFGHLEVLLGCWGIATKGSALDSFVTVVDGKVEFVPVLDDFKTAMKTFNTWYEEGLLWSECMTGTKQTFDSKLLNPECVVGVHTLKDLADNPYRDEYIRMMPPEVEGYDTLWYRHPGALGGRNAVLITDKCSDPAILCAAFDYMYALDNTVRVWYGEEADGRWTMTDGKYEFLTVPAEELNLLNENAPALGLFSNNRIYCLTAEDYASRIILSGSQKVYQDSYEMYKDIMTNTPWPRPYLTPDDATRTNELRTDIFNTTTQMRANWISGKSAIDDTFDKFKTDLEKMGLQEFIQIQQTAYDTFITAFE